MKNTTVEIFGALDVGNGYIKGEVLKNGYLKKEIPIDFPSVASMFRNPNYFLAETESSIKGVISDIYNQMDVSFSSRAVSTGERYIFGTRAINEGKMNDVFNVNSKQSKAEQELSYKMVLATFAASSLKAYYEKEGKLPDVMLQSVIDCVLALPITEYRKWKDTYKNKFESTDHVITFHNFSQPVRVELKFSSVNVTSEGACGHYYISHSYDESTKKVLALEGAYKSSDDPDLALVLQRNTVGIDIGEGTVNFPVTVEVEKEVNGEKVKGTEFLPASSGTLKEGFGTVLDLAIRNSNELMTYGMGDRKDLADFLIKVPDPNELSSLKAKYNKVKQIILRESIPFVSDIISELRMTLSFTKGKTTVIFVYGGGSIFIRELLMPEILKAVEGMEIKVVYINENQARFINKKGLKQMAKVILNAKNNLKK